MTHDKNNVVYVRFGSETKANELYERGVTLDDEGVVGAAEKLYERALELNPNHVNALINLGAVRIGQNNPFCAEKYFCEALRQLTLYCIQFLYG